MNKPTKIAVLATVVILGLTYAATILPAYNSAGYATASERSYTRGSSFFFWSGSGRVFSNPSTRGGSRSGPGVRGGGFRGGK